MGRVPAQWVLLLLLSAGMSAADASSVVASLAPNGSSIDVTYVPQCATAVNFSDYVLTAAANYDPNHFQYYKVRPTTIPL